MPFRICQVTRKNSSNFEPTADALHSAAIKLLRYVRKEDGAAGVTGAQLSVLSVLVFAGPQTLGTLAAAEQVRPPTMSQMVAELERKGLALRQPIDRRSIRISVTEKGRRLLDAGRKRRLARLSEGLSRLPARDVEMLHKAAALMLKITDVPHQNETASA
jgi:DNA-binding MarR family transcriptional regulator